MIDVKSYASQQFALQVSTANDFISLMLLDGLPHAVHAFAPRILRLVTTPLNLLVLLRGHAAPVREPLAELAEAVCEHEERHSRAGDGEENVQPEWGGAVLQLQLELVRQLVHVLSSVGHRGLASEHGEGDTPHQSSGAHHLVLVLRKRDATHSACASGDSIVGPVLLHGVQAGRGREGGGGEADGVHGWCLCNTCEPGCHTEGR
mmetsp:Transcript_5460/g.11132  ORF Transcript_5460/g.11132 Transcript_5460/m.11132 type:complete len:205 (+) Transcript_5460:168-782(+)